MRNALLAAALVFSTASFGKTVDGTVAFSGKTLGGMVKLEGTGAHVTGTVDVKDGKATGTLKCALKEFTTGLDLRDDHMRNKYLEVAKNPDAVLVLDPWTVSDKGTEFTGKLTIKGQTKPVKGLAQVEGGRLHAGFVVKLSDYPAIGAPSFKGVAVQDEIAVSVEANVQ